MPVYAPQSAFASRSGHPQALLLIVAGHAALLAAAMSARMDLPARILPQITEVTLIEPPDPPPPEPPQPRQPASPRDSIIDRPPPLVPVPPLDAPAVDPTPLPPLPGDLAIGNSVVPVPQPRPLPLPDPVRAGPRFATPADLVRPPYPPEKLRSEEEAVLRLRLSIDPRGRVVAVEPIGPADRAFVEAARRHILARWRYRPATEDGRAVAATTVVTLAFRIEE